MGLPTREEILAFVTTAKANVGKREIARHFGLRGAERAELKDLLADMVDDGQLDPGAGRSLHKAGGLPHVTVLKITAATSAKITAVPDPWEEETPPPRVTVRTDRGAPRGKSRSPRLEAGDRVLARLTETPSGWDAVVMKRLRRTSSTMLGVARSDGEGGFRLQPVDRRERRDWPLDHREEVTPGELIMAELRGTGARTRAHVVERLGDPFAAKSLSLIAIAAKNIPDHFSDEVLQEADGSGERALGPREDWTALPLITIDPADARDHDDAVWAEPAQDGHRLIVAIADVSYYVRPGTALDHAAFDRGNSIYFPDRVVPMLPHALSSGACSLKATGDRAVLAADMLVGTDGEIKSFSFHRARVRVAANIAYEEAQEAADAAAGPLWENILKPLWACWKTLESARHRRDPLELELPEKRVILNDSGDVTGIAVRERLDAHRVVEDMMIAANVAAALALEKRKYPLMYRDHEVPDRAKLTALKDYLATLGLSFALGQVITPETFNKVLRRAGDRDDLPLIAEAILRAQTQAYYAPRNTGHFGLALGSYVHFTSPIRRYSDVLVHRSLVSTFDLGEGGLPPGAEQRFAAIGEHISFTERRAMEAERETLDRYIARHMANHVGEIVRARITGVQAFGLFATIDPIGGDGLLPVSALGTERFHYDEASRSLKGVESGTSYHIGQMLDLRLEEADPATGSLRFSLPDADLSTRPRIRREGRRDRRGGPPPGVRRGRR
ncbi:MAG: VacB/RNase II family 3'-5' exoribonuclease [Sphingomonadaceae bacterium]